MPETKDSARRWSGYVCPNCRFVFRAPMDDAGQGGVCPGCRRLLRIPAAGEQLPSLVVPSREFALEAKEEDFAGAQIQPLRRKKNEHHGENQSWEQQSESTAGSRVEENRQLFWMLIGGATLFLLIVGVLAMLGGDDSELQQFAGPPPPIVIESEIAETVAKTKAEKENKALLAEAKLLAGTFLEARRIEEMLPLVRNPELAEARMRGHYPGGEIEAPGLSEFNTAGGFYRMGSSFEVHVRTRDYQDRPLAFCETPEGIKIDWESWVGWSEIPWEEFLASKPTTGKLFRMKLNSVNYYNFSFSDEKTWNAYRLESPDGKSAVYGYVERDSELDSQLKIPRGSKQIALTLSLKFPAGAKTDNQVLIEKIIAKGWLLETVKTP